MPIPGLAPAAAQPRLLAVNLEDLDLFGDEQVAEIVSGHLDLPSGIVRVQAGAKVELAVPFKCGAVHAACVIDQLREWAAGIQQPVRAYVLRRDTWSRVPFDLKLAVPHPAVPGVMVVNPELLNQQVTFGDAAAPVAKTAIIRLGEVV